MITHNSRDNGSVRTQSRDSGSPQFLTATNDDTLSIARVTVSKPTAEPWLTLDYDEWIVVVKGCIELHSEKDGVLTVKAGETAFVSKGERFQPVFPDGETEYIPVCLPAFRPDRCLREEEIGTSDVSEKLKQLHSNTDASALKDLAKAKYAAVDALYHMCQKDLWDQAVASSAPYFPPTFEKDGMFTHATAVPERLIKTANHFYTGIEGKWICLRLSRSALYKLGIDTVFEEPKPVGETGVGGLGLAWVCPHVFGGIPTCVDGVVTGTFDMKREPDGTFVSIIGLTDKN
jgi:mannose-6-phosphate isomerase-like protein (cupin superfamily)/uncharacterized protein (DUF952 family)